MCESIPPKYHEENQILQKNNRELWESQRGNTARIAELGIQHSKLQEKYEALFAQNIQLKKEKFELERQKEKFEKEIKETNALVVQQRQQYDEQEADLLKEIEELREFKKTYSWIAERNRKIAEEEMARHHF